MGSFTKWGATPFALKYTFAEGGGATAGVATLAAATMLADAAPGPLKDWLRKHRSDNNSTWQAHPFYNEISLHITQGPDPAVPYAEGPCGVGFSSVGGINNMLASVVGLTSGGAVEAIIEIRFNHSMAR